MRTDERYLMNMLRSYHLKKPDVAYVAGLIEISKVRAEAICLKWENLGWYEYGFTILEGKLTEEGRKQ